MVELENIIPEHKNINNIQVQEIQQLQVNSIMEKFDPPFHDKIDDSHSHKMTYFDLCCIASVQHGVPIEEYNKIPITDIDVAINAITSTKTTKEEMKLGHFTRQRLKGLSNWNEWRDAKF